jgi:hypothetical protein
VEGVGEFGNFAELHVETSVAVPRRDCFQSCVVVIVIGYSIV